MKIRKLLLLLTLNRLTVFSFFLFFSLCLFIALLLLPEQRESNIEYQDPIFFSSFRFLFNSISHSWCLSLRNVQFNIEAFHAFVSIIFDDWKTSTLFETSEKRTRNWNICGFVCARVCFVISVISYKIAMQANTLLIFVVYNLHAYVISLMGPFFFPLLKPSIRCSTLFCSITININDIVSGHRFRTHLTHKTNPL